MPNLILKICDDVITHLEQDFLEFEVKWALGSITENKASGNDGIPVELFQILKVLHSICQQIWKTQQWPQDWKRSVFIPIPKKGHAKKCSKERKDPLWTILRHILYHSSGALVALSPTCTQPPF